MCNKKSNICLTKTCSTVEKTGNLKYLGVVLDQDLNWKSHATNVKIKLNNVIRLFYFLRSKCSGNVLRMLYFALVQSRIEYGLFLWGSAYNVHLNSIFLQQKHFVRIITAKKITEPSRPLFVQLKILPLKYLFVFKVLKYYIRSHLSNFHNQTNKYKNKLRNADHVEVPKPRNVFFSKSYIFIGPWVFNKLPNSIKNSVSETVFIKKLKIWLLGIEHIDRFLNIPT